MRPAVGRLLLLLPPSVVDLLRGSRTIRHAAVSAEKGWRWMVRGRCRKKGRDKVMKVGWG